MKNYRTRGQTIIEVIVVIGIVVVLTTGLIAGTTSSLKSAQSDRSRSEAVKYAQEGIEVARQLRDENWDTFFSYGGSVYCLGSDAKGNTNFVVSTGGQCPTNIMMQDGTLSIFTRSVQFAWQGNSGMQIVVTVSYPENSQTKNVQLTTYLTQWR